MYKMRSWTYPLILLSPLTPLVSARCRRRSPDEQERRAEPSAEGWRDDGVVGGCGVPAILPSLGREGFLRRRLGGRKSPLVTFNPRSTRVGQQQAFAGPHMHVRALLQTWRCCAADTCHAHTPQMRLNVMLSGRTQWSPRPAPSPRRTCPPLHSNWAHRAVDGRRDDT